jgi:O-antigen/teichoic acid export membrane protein
VQVISFGAWSFVQHLAAAIRSSADPLILNKLATAMDVSCFHLGNLAHREIESANIRVSSVLGPQLTAMHAMGDVAGLRQVYSRGGRYALWAVLLLATPLIIYCREFTHLYVGPAFLAMGTVMALMLSTFIVNLGHIMISNIAYATATIRCVALRQLVIQLVNLGLTLYFVGVQEMGAVGSAFATFLCATLLQPLLLWRPGLRMVGLTFHAWLRQTAWPGILPALTGSVTWLILQALIRPTSWAALAGSVVIGAAVYISVLLTFCLQPYDRDNLRRFLEVVKSALRLGTSRSRK